LKKQESGARSQKSEVSGRVARGMGGFPKVRLVEITERNTKEQKGTTYFSFFCFKGWKGAGSFVRPFRAYGFMGTEPRALP
jgi:hypothetical protein